MSNKQFIFLLTLLLTMLGSTDVSAGDYVNDLNNGSYGDGQHVIYEMNVGMFTQAGTFSAAREQLDELKATGVDIVWLMPVFPRGGGINSPYAPTNFQQVNPAYGSVSDLAAFVARAHELNMQVWLDWVPNHTATDADWVTTHPEYYGWNGQQEFAHPNGYGDVWQLNYYNMDLRAAMNSALKFWIDEADVDGFRCDFISSPQIPATYWTAAIPEVKGHRSGKTVTFLGEADLTSVSNLANVGFDYDYAWNFQSQLTAFKSSTSASTLQSRVTAMLTASSGKSFRRMFYLTNHDQNYESGSLATVYGDNRYALTVLTFTLGGMPLLYNGQEIGGSQKLNYFEDTKVNWTSVDKKMLNTVRTLAAMKHSVAALADGATVNSLTSGNSSVYAYRLNKGSSEALVVLNLGAAGATASVQGITAGEYGLWLNSETISQGVSRHQVNLTSTTSITLEGRGYRVYVKGSFTEEELPVPDVYVPTLDSADEVSIFFETATEDAYAVWVWGDLGGGEAYCTNTSWPGDAMTLMGVTQTGRYVYKYKVEKTGEAPSFLIISKNGGNSKIYDGVAFVNHGYYVEGTATPTQIITLAGINILTPDPSPMGEGNVYDLQGRRVEHPTRGIYIRNGRKIIVGR